MCALVTGVQRVLFRSAAAEVILAQDEGFALVPGVAAADRQAEPVGEIEGRIAEYGEGRGVDIGLGKGGQSRESVEDAHVEQSVGARVEIIDRKSTRLNSSH